MSETLRDMLVRMEREVETKIADLRNQLAPLERELADIKSAQAGLRPREQTVKVGIASETNTAGSIKPVRSPYQSLTIKQLVLKALREHFPNGATAIELLAFFSRAWDRNDIKRPSLSPQLSRLKVDEKIDRKGLIWFLVDKDKEKTPPEDQSDGVSGGGGGSPPSFESQERDLLG